MATLKTTVLSQLANKIFKGRPARLQKKFWEACQSFDAPINAYAIDKHWKQLRKLLRKGADINAPTPEGDTPLILLCRNRHDFSIVRLIEHGADITPANNNGTTALLAAAAAGCGDGLNKLIEQKADLLVTDKGDNNALALLIAAEITPNHSPRQEHEVRSAFYRLVHESGLAFTDQMKIDVYHNKPHLSGMVRDITAVQELVKFSRDGNHHVVNELLYWGVPADEPATVFKDISPLAASAEAGKLDVMELLISNGAKIDLVSPKTNMTPLQHAARGGCKEAFNLLLDHGALPDHSANLIELARESGVAGMASHVFDRMMDMGVIKTSTAAKAAMKPLRFKKPSALA